MYRRAGLRQVKPAPPLRACVRIVYAYKTVGVRGAPCGAHARAKTVYLYFPPLCELAS